MRYPFLSIFLLASLMVNGGVVFMSWPYLKTFFQRVDQEKTSMRVRHAVNVKASSVKQQEVLRKQTFSGVVKAAYVVPIMAEVQGRIKKINFHQGQSVKKDQLLIQLDDEQAKNSLKEAMAQLKVNRSNYSRQVQLKAKGYGSSAAFEKAEAEMMSAGAQVEKARIHLKYTRIMAPFDGDIGLVNISEGAQVQTGQEITRLVSNSSLMVEFQVPEAEVRYIQQGQEAEVLVEGFDALPVPSFITAIEPYSDPIAHTITIKAKLDNPDKKFRDGAYARVTVALSTENQAIVIPKEAYMREDEQDFVFVIENGRAMKRPITVGIRDSDFIQVTEGLKPGEVVITDQGELLTDGFPVKIDTSN